MIAVDANQRTKLVQAAVFFMATLLPPAVSAQNETYASPRQSYATRASERAQANVGRNRQPLSTTSPGIYDGQQWSGRARCHAGEVPTRLTIESVGPPERRPNSIRTFSAVSARFEYGPAEKPIGIASFRGRYMIEGNILELDGGEWISRPQGLLSILRLYGNISSDNRVLSGPRLAAIACDDFSMASDPERASELVAAGQEKADAHQKLRASQFATRQAQELEKTKSRTHLVSVKTGEPVLCKTWQLRVDENGKTRRFCNGEEVTKKYYLDPAMKLYSIAGQGKAYMGAMGLNFNELSSKMNSISLEFSDFVWSEPITVRDANGFVPPVTVVLGCRTKIYYCSPTFQYSDAIFLADEQLTVGMWFVNQETGMAQSCRITKRGLDCVRPEEKLGQQFNEVFIWPQRFVNPLSAVKEHAKRSFEWATISDRERAEEAVRIQRVNKEFADWIRGVAAEAFANMNSGRDCDANCQQHQDWADRQNRAHSWASKERGRQPADYRGN